MSGTIARRHYPAAQGRRVDAVPTVQPKGPLRLEPFPSWRKKLNAPRKHPEAHDQEDGPELGEGVVLRTLILLREPSAFRASVLLLLLPHYLWEPRFYKGKDCWVRPRPYPRELLPCFLLASVPEA